MRITMTLIRLHRCAGWFENLLGVPVPSYVFGRCNSFVLCRNWIDLSLWPLKSIFIRIPPQYTLCIAVRKFCISCETVSLSPLVWPIHLALLCTLELSNDIIWWATVFGISKRQKQISIVKIVTCDFFLFPSSWHCEIQNIHAPNAIKVWQYDSTSSD